MSSKLSSTSPVSTEISPPADRPQPTFGQNCVGDADRGRGGIGVEVVDAPLAEFHIFRCRLWSVQTVVLDPLFHQISLNQLYNKARVLKTLETC